MKYRSANPGTGALMWSKEYTPSGDGPKWESVGNECAIQHCSDNSDWEALGGIEGIPSHVEESRNGESECGFKSGSTNQDRGNQEYPSLWMSIES
jgi:hypothetical protein